MARSKTLSVKINGAKAFKDRYGRYDANLEKFALRKILRDLGSITQSQAAEVFIVRGREKLPALPNRLSFRSGRLTRSIAADFGGLPFEVRVGTNVEYGEKHEKGLRGFPVRAFLSPALEVAHKKSGPIVSKIMDKWATTK